MISSLLVAREQIIREQRVRIATLEVLLKLAGDAWRPADAVIQ
jgi:hypothetical protein